jgi:hypothetical protein
MYYDILGALILSFFFSGVEIYFFIVVYSYYKELKTGGGGDITRA